MSKDLFAITRGFKLKGEVLDVFPYGEGHINGTFYIKTTEKPYILQKINNYVFKDVDLLMNNISVVTKFIRSKGQESLEIVPTLDDKLYLTDESGYYRVYVFVENTICYQRPENLDLVRSAGESFGALHQALNDFPVEQIGEVIPHFHDTEKRFSDFIDAYAKASDELRKNADKEVNFILSHRHSYGIVNEALKNNEILMRVTHNDTKINNVLFDATTGKFRCVIDLDTIMPGSMLFDVGDAFRSMFTGTNEDNKDTSNLKVDFEVYKTYIKAYLGKMKNDLTKKEIELIPFSIYLLTIECGIRFLEDYLRGNVYFAIKYKEHNLVRARTQIALAKDVLENVNKLNKITEEIVNELN